MAVQLIVVIAANGHRKFVADLAAQSSPLREFQVMGIARLALADHACLPPNEGQMGFASPANCLWQRDDRTVVDRMRIGWVAVGQSFCINLRRDRDVPDMARAGNLLQHRPISGLNKPGVIVSQGVLGW